MGVQVEFSECRGHCERSSLTEREDNANAPYFAYNFAPYFVIGDGVLYENLGQHFARNYTYACMKNVLTGGISDMLLEHFETLMFCSQFAWEVLSDMEVIAWASK